MRGARSTVAGVAVGALLMLMQMVGTAQASTTSTLRASFAPDRLDAKGALTLEIGYADGETGIPSPLRQLVVMLPAGLGIDIPSLRSCSAARLRSRGPSGCPSRSRIGAGHALVEARAGSQLITEGISLSVFLGPLHGFQPTFEVFGQGHTPLLKRIVLGGGVIPGHAPYGEELVMDIPTIPTVPLEPDAALTALTLTVGASAQREARSAANAIVVPGSCPPGGFPFATESTYADGSTDTALATIFCPR